MSLSLFPHAEAQLTEQEFQMGRAREACYDQARTQMLTVNRVISTTPVTDSAGRMIGAEVILNVTRSGQTYSVRCMYDNTARTANIFNISPPGGIPPGSPNAGTFQGRGIASGSVFTAGRQADTMLNFNANNFSYGIAATAVSGTEVNYQGIITQRRAGSSLGRNGFVLETKVQRFASSANNLRVQNASGSCRIEIFDARVVSSTCNIAIPNGSTRFDGLKQF